MPHGPLSLRPSNTPNPQLEGQVLSIDLPADLLGSAAPRAVVVYAHLSAIGRLSDPPPHAEVARALHMDPRIVSRARSELRRKGWLR
jgi:hypothetical protein